MDFKDNIFVGITTTNVKRKKDHWREQLKEINALGITKIAIFPTCLDPKERKEFYRCLEESCVKEIVLTHMRGQDFTKKEIKYLMTKFKCKYFNCHEVHLDSLCNKFPEFCKNIVLELNYDNQIENKVHPEDEGGFCLDLSHMFSAKNRHCVEWDYALKHIKKAKVFANHLNGYSKSKKKDIHFITNKKQLDYLKEMPKEFFSKIICFECENSIKKQLEYRDYVAKILNKKFGK